MLKNAAQQGGFFINFATIKIPIIMKTKIILSSAFVIIVAILIISSCKKDKVKGCMDSVATNYNSKATEDDGSCKYQGSLVFWNNMALQDTLTAHGSDTLIYYINNVKVGTSIVASSGRSGAPSCGQSGVFTLTEQLGSVKSQTYQYSVNDNSGYFTWSGTVTITATPSCTPFQILYSAIQ